MASSDQKLEQQLVEVGDRLVDPPSSVDELLPLLDKVEKLLTTIEQTPSLPMKNAMSKAHEALVAENFLKHSDADVQVAVAACLTEILRIAAPDAPYDDDIMKKLFQLIVSTFENLDDKSSRSYDKRVMILDTSAKVQSCVVMLDLECDALIVEMFKTFLRTIRCEKVPYHKDYHSDSVFSSMVAIMTLVFEESEEISPELIFPILSCLRQDNKEVLPIAQRLAEEALRSSSLKAKTNLKRAIQSMGISLADYNDVVASICQDKSGDEQQNQVAVNANVNQVEEVIPAEAAPEEVDVPNDISPKSEISNDVTQAKDESLIDSCSTKKEECASDVKIPKSSNGSSNAEPDSQGSEHKEHANASLVTNNKAVELVVASKNGKEMTSEQEQVESPDKDAKQSADDVWEDASGAFDSEAKTATLADGAKKEGNLATDSEEKPLKRLRKRVEKYDNSIKGSVRRTKRKIGELNACPGKDSLEASAKDDEKKTVIALKLSSKAEKEEHANEEEHGSEATPKTNSKRKRMPAKEKVVTSSVEEKASDAEECGENLINSRIKVWWPLDCVFYEGVVCSYNAAKNKHQVLYDDGDQEILNLKREKWELIESNAKPDEDEADGGRSPVVSSKIRAEKKKKTAKTSEKPAKQGKQSDSSAKSKSKASGTKAGEKSEDNEKKVEKSGEKESSKAKDKSGGIGGKMVAVASRLTAKSRANNTSVEADVNGSKSSTKSKKETPKALKSKANETSPEGDVNGSKSSAKPKKEASRSSKSVQITPKASKSKANETSLKDDVNGSKSLAKSKKETPKSSKSVQKTPKVSGKTKTMAKNTDDDEDDYDEDAPLLDLILKLRVAASKAIASGREESGKKRKR